MRPATYPNTIQTVRQTDGVKRAVHIIPCGCPGCTSKIEVPLQTGRKPPVFLDRIVRNKGWSVQKKTYRCPEHM